MTALAPPRDVTMVGEAAIEGVDFDAEIPCETRNRPAHAPADFIVKSADFVRDAVPDGRWQWAICRGCYDEWISLAIKHGHPTPLHIVKVLRPEVAS